MLADGIVRAIQIVGEAARNISAEFVAAHPEVMWRAIIKTRHILVHNYADVDLEIVWRILEQHLPPLIEQVTTILDKAPPPDTEA